MKTFWTLFLALAMSTQAFAGAWTANQFIYKPGQGARGVTEKNTFDSGMNQVDTRLGKEVWVGDPAYGATFQNAIAAIGSNAVTLRIPAGTHSITADLTTPENIVLKPERGAVFSIATAKTFTINGSLQAGLYQIFSCTGTGKVVLRGDRYPQWWGAAGDGVTDDYAAIQRAITSVTDSGVPGIVRLTSKSYYVTPNNLGYKINSGLVLDPMLVSLIGDGAIINAAGLTDGVTAITITGSLGADGNPGTEIGGFLLYGPSASGACIGIKLAQPGSPGSAAHISLKRVRVGGFGTGISCQDRAYLNSFFDVELTNNGIGFELPAGYTDYGENIRFFGGLFSSNVVAVKAYSGAGDIYFYGTSFDFNVKDFDISGSHVNMFGGHIEHQDISATIIDVAGSGGLFYMNGGELLLASGGSAPLTTNYVASCASPASIILENVFQTKTRTATGRFASGVGYIKISGGTSYSTDDMAPFTSDAMTALSDGSFETGNFINNIFLTYDSVAFTSRITGTNISLAIPNTYGRTGTYSLRVTKGGAGGAARFAVAIPIQPGQYANGEFYYKKAGAQTGTMAVSYQFMLLETDGNGVPRVKQALVVKTNEITFTAAAVDWTKDASQQATNVRAPAWATHYVIEPALEGVGAGELYFDDFVMTVQ